MPYQFHRTFAASLSAFTLALFASSPAAAQAPIPTSAAWRTLPSVLPEGATVVVRTRDGSSMKGRLHSLSDSAIVLDGGRVRTIPAAAVASIEGGRGSRPVKRGARIGLEVGLVLAGLYSLAATDTHCEPDECVTWSDALFGAFFLPAAGAGIGAGIGLMVPGKRALIYTAGAELTLELGPIAGRGRRGAAVRVAF